MRAHTPSNMEKETERPLLRDNSLEEGSDDSFIVKPKPRTILTLRNSLFVNAGLLALLVIFAVAPWLSREQPKCQDVFSPAQNAIEYETRVFRSGLHGDMTEYQGSSEEVAQRWEDLYNKIGMNQIDESIAKKLPNATTPMTYDSSKYVIQLDVFHTIHCLNLLRKRLYTDVYPPDNSEDAIYHLEHCVESIRQSLQCSSDVSTIYWEWSEKEQKMMGNLKTTHTCRNFEKIQDWARAHVMPQDTDFLQYVPGSPLRIE